MSGLLYIGSLFLVLAPAMVGVFLENAKKPVRVSKGNLHLLAEPTQLRPDVDEVSERYKDPSIRKRLRKNAKLLYYVGWLCAWDDKKLGTVLMTIVTFLLYLLMSFFIIPFLFRYQIYGLIFRVLTVFYAPITLYLVFKAWRNGGGKGKAMQRRNVLKCLKNGFDLERVLSNENMLESFSSCNYRKPTELATLDDFATRLYIKSLVNRTFGWTNDEDI